MEMKNPPPMMTEKMPTTKPPTRRNAVSRVSSQGASAVNQERSITVLSPDLLPFQRRHDSTRQETAALRDFDLGYDRLGSTCELARFPRDVRCSPIPRHSPLGQTALKGLDEPTARRNRRHTNGH